MEFLSCEDKKVTIVMEHNGKRRGRIGIEGLYAYFFLGALILIMVFASDAFLTPYNLYNLLSTAAIKGILACGMTFIIITGGIDISVGSNLAFGGILVAALLGSTNATGLFAHLGNVPVPLAMLIGVLACSLIGFCNGFMVTKLRIPPFIATMGMMQITRGLSYICSGGFAVTFKKDIPSFQWIGSGKIGAVPSIAIFFIVIAVIFGYILKFTSYGRFLCAIGNNEVASRFSGISVNRIKMLAYTTLGTLAGLGGIILTARLNSATPDAGMGYELDCITAVVIGGTSLSGGKGTIAGTVAGIFIMVVLATSLNLLGVQSIYQYLSKGLILLIAVLIDSYLNKRRG